MRKVVLILRAIMLLAVIALALGSVVSLLGKLEQHRAVRQQVNELEARQSELMDEYSSAVSSGQKLKSDPEAQVSLLKERMGYARRNETPVVVSIETPAADSVD